MRRSLGRVPVWAWLAAIVGLSALLRAVLVRGIPAPFIIVDEILWSEVARGLADAGEPLVRDTPDPGLGIVYPLVIAPAYLAVDGLVDAYAAVKLINSIVMSLAAIPAYFLARRVVGQWLALLAAVLALAVPSVAYTGTVMTENVFYPLFLVVAFVLVLVLERPTGLRVALLVGLVAVAFATRVQAAAFVPAILFAPLVLAALEGVGLRDTVRRYRVLFGTFVSLGALALVLRLVTGKTPQDLLGAYEPVGEADYEVAEVLRYLAYHVAELVLYLLVVPVAATIVLVARARSLDRRLQAFLAATLALTVCILPVVAAFASVFSHRIEERNMFYVAPLYLVALLAWVERGAPRPRAIAVGAASACALAVLAIPFDRFLTTSAISDTLMLLPLWSLQDRIGEEWIATAALVSGFLLALAFLFVPRRFAVVLPLLVLGLWAVAFEQIWWGQHGFEQFSRGVLFQGIRAPHRDWIDRALPDGARAGFLWTGRTDRLTVNQNEFFSRGVGPVYYVDQPTPGNLPETRVTIDPRTGAVTLPDGSPVTDEYLLADATFEPTGRAVAFDLGWGIRLWRVSTPLESATRVDGLYPNDTWSGEEVTYVRRHCGPGRLMVELSSDAALFFEPQTVVARADGKEIGRVRLPVGGQAALMVPLAPPPGEHECRVVFTVTPTAVPSEVTGGTSPDERVLGAHFNGFRYTPSS
ncbi:MAG TPA: glycosyltransferase family 39 protein [Gaiellaceae bacterium]|nr:glycosyltransferase family 39 protein [Gaiellaceae bacterium]